MRLRLTRRALADAKRMKTWWRRNRTKAEELFEQELDRALERIVAMPNVGSIYEQRDLDVEVRRLLMPKTHNHVYYAVTAKEIVVLTVWGASKGRGPKL
jgi:plasmid stabilization system protein ParE